MFFKWCKQYFKCIFESHNSVFLLYVFLEIIFNYTLIMQVIIYNCISKLSLLYNIQLCEYTVLIFLLMNVWVSSFLSFSFCYLLKKMPSCKFVYGSCYMCIEIFLGYIPGLDRIIHVYIYNTKLFSKVVIPITSI